MNSTTHTSYKIFCSNSSPILEWPVKFASQICHDNIDKPLDGTYLADFGIDINLNSILIDLSSTFQATTCLGVTASFLKSLPALPSVTLIPTSWTRRHSLSSPRAGQYSGSPPRRPYSSSLRSILYEGSPYMSSPIHSSLLPSFVPFSSIVTS